MYRTAFVFSLLMCMSCSYAHAQNPPPPTGGPNWYTQYPPGGPLFCGQSAPPKSCATEYNSPNPPADTYCVEGTCNSFGVCSKPYQSEFADAARWKKEHPQFTGAQTGHEIDEIGRYVCWYNANCKCVEVNGKDVCATIATSLYQGGTIAHWAQLEQTCDDGPGDPPPGGP
jgi:hypothetical protein